MLALLLALAATASLDTDMLAQYRSGKRLCLNPDPQARTCSSIERLDAREDGSLSKTSETLIAPDKPFSVETTSPVRMEGEEMCGIITLDSLEKGVVRANGTPLPKDSSEKILFRLSEAIQSLDGQKACGSLRVEEGQLVKVSRIVKLDLPLPERPARWVGPDEGYRVAPGSAQPQ